MKKQFFAAALTLISFSALNAQQYGNMPVYNTQNGALYGPQNQNNNAYYATPSQPSQRVLVYAGTPLELETLMPADGKYLNVGQTIEFRVKYDVVVNRHIVIAAGSPARGIITRLDKPKMMGKGGFMEIQPQYVTTVDNQNLPISAMPMRLEGKKNGWAAAGVAAGIVTGGVAPLATAFVKGKDAKMESGVTVFGSVASTREVWVNN